MRTVPQRVLGAVGRTVGFRARIVMVVLATTIAFALFVVARSSHYVSEGYIGGAQGEVLAVGRTFNGELTPRDVNDRAALSRRLDRLKAGNPNVLKAALYVLTPAGGRRIASTARGEIGQRISAHDVAPIRTGKRRIEALRERGGHLFELHFPLRAGGARPYAALGLYFDLRAVDATVTARKRTLLLVGLVAALAAGVLVAASLGVLIFRPIAKLRAATHRMRAGDLSGRLNWKRSDQLGALARDVDQMASAVEERERFESLALKDPLTGLANHRHFQAVLDTELEIATAEGTSLALGLLDLDHFKSINDKHGHPFGDEVLRQAAAVLAGRVRTRDVVARVGGEEFAVILPGCDDAAAMEVIEKARTALSIVSAGDRRLSASAGVAAFPQHAQDYETLVEVADGALYWAKRSGRDTTRRYDPRYVRAPSRGDDGVEIAAVLEHPSGIAPVFQPIVALSSGAVAGYEALARFAPWAARAEPQAWFARAQRVGQRDRMEAKALCAALAQPGRPAGTFLSLNLSPSAVASAEIRHVLPEDLSGIVLEVSEAEVVAGGPGSVASAAAVRARGAWVAVDHAAGDLAALAHLAALRPAIIKLDATLVHGVHTDPARAAVIAALVAFGDRTGAKLCATCIESAEDLRVVAEAGVTYAQGHALAPPAAGWPTVTAQAVAAIGAVRAAGHPALTAPPTDP